MKKLIQVVYLLFPIVLSAQISEYDEEENRQIKPSLGISIGGSNLAFKSFPIENSLDPVLLNSGFCLHVHAYFPIVPDVSFGLVYNYSKNSYPIAGLRNYFENMANSRNTDLKSFYQSGLSLNNLSILIKVNDVWENNFGFSWAFGPSLILIPKSELGAKMNNQYLLASTEAMQGIAFSTILDVFYQFYPGEVFLSYQLVFTNLKTIHKVTDENSFDINGGPTRFINNMVSIGLRRKL